MSTCSVYKGCTLLGTGSISAAGTTITSWTATTAAPAVLRKNVGVAITSSTHAGSVFRTRVTADNGSGTLTLADANPFAT
jgi:hypothetical protein